MWPLRRLRAKQGHEVSLQDGRRRPGMTHWLKTFIIPVTSPPLPSSNHSNQSHEKGISKQSIPSCCSYYDPCLCFYIHCLYELPYGLPRRRWMQYPTRTGRRKWNALGHTFPPICISGSPSLKKFSSFAVTFPFLLRFTIESGCLFTVYDWKRI